MALGKSGARAILLPINHRHVAGMPAPRSAVADGPCGKPACRSISQPCALQCISSGKRALGTAAFQGRDAQIERHAVDAARAIAVYVKRNVQIAGQPIGCALHRMARDGCLMVGDFAAAAHDLPRAAARGKSAGGFERALRDCAKGPVRNCWFSLARKPRMFRFQPSETPS